MMTTLRSFASQFALSESTPIVSHGLIVSRKIAKVRMSTRALAGYLAIALATVTMATAQQTPTPLQVITADFNHDGIPDALVVSATAPTATIAFGSVPYGTFSSTAKAVTFPSACTSFPQGTLVTGDFNGDGFTDIGFTCSTISGVILGNGDGTFGAVQTLAGIYGGIAVVGDFNNDGKLDIAILNTSLISSGNASQTIGVLIGMGDGTFADPVFTSLGNSAYIDPVAADINGDGYSDIVLLSTPPDVPPTVNIFGNNQASKFGIAVQGISGPNSIINVQAAAAGILVGNFFGTGANDLATYSTGANSEIETLQNISTATGYGFNDPVEVPYVGMTAAVAGNFTGTVFTDILASNGTSIAVLANSGNGRGNFAANYSALTLPSTSALFAVGDANGDGYTDVYTATSTAGVMQVAANLVSGTATATSQPFPLPIGTNNVSAAWVGNDNFLGSTASGTQLVVGVPTVATITSSKNPSLVGDSVTFTVKVASSITTDNIPSGAIVLSDGATMLASGVLDGFGGFTYTTTALTQATHSIKLTYAGDTYFAGSVSAVLSQVVNHAPAIAPNITWATPASIVYGTALSAAQLNASAADASGVAIPGVFVYTPAAGTLLDAGVKTLSVTFTPTDLLSFLPATQTVNLTVSQAVPVISWATPASVVYGTALSATQLDATAAGIAGAALPGVFTYTPAAGAIPAPGTQTLSVSFTPTNATDYTNATGTVKLLVTGVTLASITPNMATLGDPDTKITLTGAGFVATSAVQVNGASVATTFVNATTLTAIIPAASLAKAGTLQITVADVSVASVSAAVPFTVATPPLTATLSGPTTTDPGTQPVITFTINKPYPVDLTVTLTLGFAASTTPPISDPSVQFAAGGTTLTFVVPANTTTVPTIQVQSGTVAGVITVPITLTAGGVDVTPANLAPVVITVPPIAPVISDVKVTRSADQLTVVIHGFSNTREVVNAKFHFTAATGDSLATPDVTVVADTIFNTDWYGSTASDQYGSSFTYTQIFNTSNGSDNIGSVEVTLTNTIGASTSMTAQ